MSMFADYIVYILEHRSYIYSQRMIIYIGAVSSDIWLQYHFFHTSGTKTLSHAEATTCRAAIRVARGVVRDIGVSSAASSGGLADLAKCSETNSERDMYVLTRRYQLCLPIKISVINKTSGVRYTGDFEVIKLKDWCGFHLEYNTWHVMVGLQKPHADRERRILSEFWRRYKAWRPNHEIWTIIESRQIDTSRLCPMLLHGDEGRGRKKSPYLVCSYHSYLGFGTQSANAARTRKPFVTMKLNYAGNCHIHRMITCVLPKMLKDEVAFQDLQKFMAGDSLEMLLTGVKSPHDGETYRMAVLQVVGDWAFLLKIGHLSRSFANVEKRPRAQDAQPKGICHMCRAGQVNIPFEDLRMTARWVETLHDPSDSVFLDRPPFLQLPQDIGKESSYFTYDLFHAFHLGTGKVFCASVLVMISMQMTAGTVDQRFVELTRLYLDFCDRVHSSPYILSLTKEGLGWPDTKTYPNAQWSKGHITTLVLKFIQYYFERNPCDEAVDPLFPKCKQATECINKFLTGLYERDVWITASDALLLGRLGEQFFQLYMDLASQAFRSRRALFLYMPKAHITAHIVHSMLADAGRCPFVLNPLAHAAQVDEDFIGKCSRTARRIGVGQLISRALQRGLAASYKHYVQQGFLRL